MKFKDILEKNYTFEDLMNKVNIPAFTDSAGIPTFIIMDKVGPMQSQLLHQLLFRLETLESNATILMLGDEDITNSDILSGTYLPSREDYTPKTKLQALETMYNGHFSTPIVSVKGRTSKVRLNNALELINLSTESAVKFNMVYLTSDSSEGMRLNREMLQVKFSARDYRVIEMYVNIQKEHYGLYVREYTPTSSVLTDYPEETGVLTSYSLTRKYTEELVFSNLVFNAMNSLLTQDDYLDYTIKIYNSNSKEFVTGYYVEKKYYLLGQIPEEDLPANPEGYLDLDYEERNGKKIHELVGELALTRLEVDFRNGGNMIPRERGGLALLSDEEESIYRVRNILSNLKGELYMLGRQYGRLLVQEGLSEEAQNELAEIKMLSNQSYKLLIHIYYGALTIRNSYNEEVMETMKQDATKYQGVMSILRIIYVLNDYVSHLLLNFNKKYS